MRVFFFDFCLLRALLSLFLDAQRTRNSQISATAHTPHENHNILIHIILPKNNEIYLFAVCNVSNLYLCHGWRARHHAIIPELHTHALQTHYLMWPMDVWRSIAESHTNQRRNTHINGSAGNDVGLWMFARNGKNKKNTAPKITMYQRLIHTCPFAVVLRFSGSFFNSYNVRCILCGTFIIRSILSVGFYFSLSNFVVNINNIVVAAAAAFFFLLFVFWSFVLASFIFIIIHFFLSFSLQRWQRRWFVLYDDGEFTYSVDDHVSYLCILSSLFFWLLLFLHSKKLKNHKN